MDSITSNRKAVGTFGISAVAVFTTWWMFAALSDPDWIFGQRPLSRMGVSDVPLTRHLFNFACIVSGALGLVPALARMKGKGISDASADCC